MKSGFVAILGRPNVGKSTILNKILNKKVSIVTAKAQTTRNAIRGIYQSEDAQIVFVDTPGIHKPLQELDRFMNKEAFKAKKDVEAILIVCDASKPYGPADDYINKNIKVDCPVFIIINKIDLATLPQVLKLREIYSSMYENAIIIETNALDGFNIDEIIKKIIHILPEGPLYYDKNVISDQDDAFYISEIIREKALNLLKEEVPHSLAVSIEQIETNNARMDINATLVLEKESQKGIVIGKNGTMIKHIGTNARFTLEKRFKKHINLELFVKVKEAWRDETKWLRDLGYGDKK